MASQKRFKKAYAFFVQRNAVGSSFAVQDIMRATGWAESTVDTYIDKFYREILKEGVDGTYTVRPEISRLSEDDFLKLSTQKKTLYASYDLISYTDTVVYEFLLPLTRETQLRTALDNLFYEDSVKQRLAEIDPAELREAFPRGTNESDEDYVRNLCEFVSSTFGGYSITHVLGRFRTSALMTRADVGQLNTNQTPYLIDETTAAVRFIIPIESSKIAGRDPLSRPKQLDLFAPRDTTEEARRIQSLFFLLFVEAVLKTVQGEEEIWLVEETTDKRTLYKWRKS